MSQCKNNEAVLGCYSDGTNPPQTVTVHYTYDGAGQPAVHITDLAGAIVAGATAANTLLGSCSVPLEQCEPLKERGILPTWAVIMKPF